MHHHPRPQAFSLPPHMSKRNTHHLKGDLTIWNVADAVGSFSEAISDPSVSEVDVGGLTQLDLAGLQLLLWGAQQPRQTPLDWRGLERVSELLGGTYQIAHLWPSATPVARTTAEVEA